MTTQLKKTQTCPILTLFKNKTGQLLMTSLFRGYLNIIPFDSTANLSKYIFNF